MRSEVSRVLASSRRLSHRRQCGLLTTPFPPALDRGKRRVPSCRRGSLHPDGVALPPPCPGISSLRTGNGISTRESGARPGDYRTSHPRRINLVARASGPRVWRLQAARRAAGTLDDPALFPSSTSSPACRNAGPQHGHSNPSVTGTPLSPTSPRRLPPLRPAPAAVAAAREHHPAESRRRRPHPVSVSGGARRAPGSRRAAGGASLAPTLTLTLGLTAPSPRPAPPRRSAASVAAETGVGGALVPVGAEHRLAGSDRHERPGPAEAHKAPPNHFQRGAAAGARGALCTESVSRRGHTRALGGPHPPAGGTRGGGCPPRSPEANSGATLLFQRQTFHAGEGVSSPSSPR